jgi:FtsH-binding integral membrane protein
MDSLKMANDPLPIHAMVVHIIIVGLIIIAIFANSFTYTPSFSFHCSNYIANTYLYFLLTWGLALLTVHALDRQFTVKGAPLSSMPLWNSGVRIGFALLSIVLLIAMIWSRESIVWSHIFFLAWTIVIGVLLYYMFILDRNLFYSSMMTVVGILIVFTIVSIMFPNMINGKMAGYMMGVLIALIIAGLVEIILRATGTISYEDSRKISKVISYVAIVLFTLFLIYDTNEIRVDAIRCNMTSNKPNYIHSSLGIFLDTLNLLTNIFNVSSD